ncbi:MAG: LysM peptidoglycan-binding domain-containing protein, partial [Lactiplantibacillus plantarum]
MKIKNALLSTAAATASLFAIGATAQAATVTVKAGDTVSAIAADHNTTIDAIQQANHLKDVNLILVGQQLEVNGDSTNTTSTQTTTTQSSAQTSQTQAQPSQA